ncbi:MAG: hypothetical protein AMXMBFR84_49170 [Candidatus Hydrogenedentota bacterium]
MPLTPELQPGWWSGWWFTAAYWIVTLALTARCSREAIQRMTGIPEMNKWEWVSARLMIQLYFAPMVYAAFVPIKFGTIGFYLGIPIFLGGLVVYALTIIHNGSAPMDGPIEKGLYRRSRHPMYLAHFVAWIGAGLAMGSWVIILATILLMATMHHTVLLEERTCLKLYGDSYKAYMERVPRYF